MLTYGSQFRHRVAYNDTNSAIKKYSARMDNEDIHINHRGVPTAHRNYVTGNIPWTNSNKVVDVYNVHSTYSSYLGAINVKTNTRVYSYFFFCLYCILMMMGAVLGSCQLSSFIYLFKRLFHTVSPTLASAALWSAGRGLAGHSGVSSTFRTTRYWSTITVTTHLFDEHRLLHLS